MKQKKNQSRKIKGLIRVGGFLIPFVIVLLTAAGYGAYQLTYLPKISCNSCHNIRLYVESYYGSENLDNLHNQATVGAKNAKKHHYQRWQVNWLLTLAGIIRIQCVKQNYQTRLV
jgi:hypothetical protein